MDARTLSLSSLELDPNDLPLTGKSGTVALYTVSQHLHWAFLKYPGKPVAPVQLSCVPRAYPGRLLGAETALLVITPLL